MTLRPKTPTRRRATGLKQALMTLAAFSLAGPPAFAQSAGPNADGVYAESGYRLPLPRREMLDADGQKIFDRILAGNTDASRPSGPGAGLKGPLGIRLYSPRLAELGNDENAFLRFDAGLDGKTRELAILVVAHEADCNVEWSSHQILARKEGVSERAISVIRDRLPTTGLDPQEALIIDLGRQAIVEHKVSLATYQAALKAFGARQLVNLTGLMGNYLATAVLLTTFGAVAPDGASTIAAAGR